MKWSIRRRGGSNSVAEYCNTLRFWNTYCNTLRFWNTYCNTLRFCNKDCNIFETLQYFRDVAILIAILLRFWNTYCNTIEIMQFLLQYFEIIVIRFCNTLIFCNTYYNTLIFCNTLIFTRLTIVFWFFISLILIFWFVLIHIRLLVLSITLTFTKQF